MRNERLQNYGRILGLRSKIINLIRDFFTTRGYLEVETPVRMPAPAPEAHIDAEPAGDWFLQTSPELCMKRLLAAGLTKIFQICRCFRRGERGHRHLPELTLLEWYSAGQDYEDLMDQCEALLRHVAGALKGGVGLDYRGHKIDLAPPWPKMTVAAAFDRYAPLPMAAALDAGRFDEIMGLVIEPSLGFGRPVFLHDYPAACGALARFKPQNETLVERFELYIAGLELCNGFSELTDPVEQRRRFEKELQLRCRAGKPVYPLPEKFLQSLADMPAAAGNALGIDRLVMLFAGVDRIDDVVAFTPEDL